jgi:MoaA/NifB/PqqE/SkfB family radical SAM enzyme
MLTTKDLSLASVDTIVIENTTYCNLKCPTCRVTQSHQVPRLMEFSKFVQIVNSLKPYIQNARVLNISSSESLLHPRIFDMIDIVKSINPRIFVSIITNGMLLDETKQKELLKRKIDNICVSIDGAKKETAESIRVGSNFETVIKNTKLFISKGGMVRTIYTVRDNNINDLLDFVDLASTIGIWFIKCTGLIAYTQEDSKHALYSLQGLPDVDRIFSEAKKKAESKGIKFTHKGTKLEEGYCCLSRTMYVGIDGDISPCVYLSEPTSLSLLDKTRITEPVIWGNVLDKKQIWCTDESLSFRQDLMNGLKCDLCGMKYTSACGMPKS